MDELTDQLGRYGNALRDRTPPVSLDEISRLASDAEVDGTNLVHDLDLADPDRSRPPRQPVLIAAAIVAVLGIGVGAISMLRDEPAQQVVTGPDVTQPDTPEMTEPDSSDRDAAPPQPPAPPEPDDPTYGLTTGWHSHPIGPLRAPTDRFTAVWADGELIVIGSDSIEPVGAAVDPSDQMWRELSSVPLGSAWFHAPEAVWTDTEVVVVRPEPDGGPRAAAAYDPATDRWREIPDAPAAVSPIRGSVWTGTEVILFDSLAAYDPTTDAWRSLDLEAPLSDRAVAWTGKVLVFVGGQHDTIVHDPAAGDTSHAPPPPRHSTPEVYSGFMGAVWVDDRVVVVDEMGRVSRFEPDTGTWEEETTLDPFQGPCQPIGWVLDDGRTAWNLCSRIELRTTDGSWQIASLEAPTMATATNGAVLLALEGTVPGGTGPALRMWMPPPSPSTAEVADGTYHAHIHGIENVFGGQLRVELDLVEYLFNDEAGEAAVADGVIDHPDELANPVYVRGIGLPRVFLDGDPDAELTALDADLAPSRSATWSELAGAYNRGSWSGQSDLMGWPVEIDIADGTIVAIRQFYSV